ncbi:GPI-linked NAD(P)(+)--arginine ADP-ribosyltransferase 1 [Syngnathus typhle]|uniref:GPI-linked NAD(P)(+)--arginine ADP-ribosyltransferase 1 n=1 Tax=Syngnathus typhle TaxID=161592 RepID=UPI002A69ACD1|nr:GPI-linked NAD(P)(+)--arginine ADP-ribosyltransferase 1 [Syngnathus typhle]XP_061129516.1 GPI-linked NAD(P)(+)--arginine ADP-ribosyltransferase 1 [Syngnathus typhle]XP_061129517.1 GPI-linked NAD(P)(+)--arginine ADP-ribosyltransferase 1 [Syngnathus typhle]
MRAMKKTFLVVYVVLYTVSAVKQLDMAPNAVDLLYEGCRDDTMEKLIRSDVLHQELSQNIDFYAAWSDKCPTLLPGGTKEHTSALLAFINGKNAFKKAFNDAVETMGVNASTYEERFHYKSLHFLLTDAMSLVRQKTCKNVYRVSEMEYKVEKGVRVRFGRFTTVQSDVSMKEDVEGGIYFNITTCFYISLEGFCGITEDVAILSPTEEFMVEDIKLSDDGDYTEVILKHSKLKATDDCYKSRAPEESASQWPMMALVSFVLFETLNH